MKLRNIADAAESADESVEEALIHAADHLGDPVGVGNILAFLASHQADYLRQTIFTR